MESLVKFYDNIFNDNLNVTKERVDEIMMSIDNLNLSNFDEIVIQNSELDLALKNTHSQW